MGENTESGRVSIPLERELDALRQENERLLRDLHKSDLARINAEKCACYHFALNPYDLKNMLNCLAEDEISVSKAIELIASWVAKNYSDDLLPTIEV